VATIAVLALLAGALAFQQRRSARAAEARAKQKATEAADAATREASLRTDSELRRLASEAQATAASHPDLAMLLAVEAYRRQPGVGSESALDAALLSQPAIRRFFDVVLPADKTVRSMAASSAGLVALDLDGTVMILDTARMRPTGVTINPGSRSRLVFSRSGNELATATATGEIRRWDPQTGHEVAPRIHIHDTFAQSLDPPIDYLPDGSLVVADQADVQVVPPGAAGPVRHLVVPGAPAVVAIAVSPSGARIAVSWQAGADANTDGAVAVLDAADLSSTSVPWVRGVPTTLRFARDDRLFVSAIGANVSGSIGLVDVVTGSLVGGVADVISAPLDLVTVEDGGALAAPISGGLLRVRPDLSVGPRIELRGLIPLTRLPDGTILGVASGRLVEIDPDELSAIGSRVSANGRQAVGLLAGAEGKLLLRNPDSTMVVVDRATLAPLSPPLVASVPVGTNAPVSLSPDGAQVAVAGPTGVEVIDVAPGRSIRTPIPIPSFDRPAFSPDGHQLLLGGIDGKLHLIDVATGTERWARDFHGEAVLGSGWSNDGRLVAARTFRGDVRILDASTGADVTGPMTGVFDLTFAPAGETAVVAGTTGTDLRIIDARTGTAVRTFPGLGGFYFAVFVRNGRWVSAMTGSGLVELIDIESGTRLGVPIRVTRDAVSGGYSSFIVSNGLYWGPADRPVVYYDLDPDSWATTACRAAGRNLTREEWDQYVGSLGPYRATCSQYPAAS
jgi:WD40 repeat protein